MVKCEYIYLIKTTYLFEPVQYVFQDGRLEKRPQCIKSALPKFVSALTCRSRSKGQVEGLLRKETLDIVIERMIQLLNQSNPLIVSQEEYEDTLWTSTALFVGSQGKNSIE
jgi:hypothetical protein